MPAQSAGEKWIPLIINFQTEQIGCIGPETSRSRISGAKGIGCISKKRYETNAVEGIGFCQIFHHIEAPSIETVLGCQIIYIQRREGQLRFIIAIHTPSAAFCDKCSYLVASNRHDFMITPLFFEV